MQTVKFFTIGCKVNQYDTQNIREQFLGTGFKELDDNAKADIYVINTCTVTHHADRDSLYIIRKAKKENPKAKIIVTGCLTELDEDKIKNIDSKITIIKNKDKENILFYLKIPLSFPLFEKGGIQGGFLNKGITYFKGHTRAFLKIQDGCNNFCSYCKVPFVRGRSISKSLNIVVKEAKQLVKNGFKEIVLCGICLGAYGRDMERTCFDVCRKTSRKDKSPHISPLKKGGERGDLVDVINRLENIEELLRIRLSSIEPKDVSDELIEKIKHSRKLCPHLHIPFQSGDDEILKKMNRNYTADEYLELVKQIRRKVPDVAITTDVLVGFPGETEVNFKNTVKLIKKIAPLKVHIFPYSRRQGTSVVLSSPLVGEGQGEGDNSSIIQQRVNFLKRISEDLSKQYRKKFLNKTMDVLIEDRHKERNNLWEGLTDNYIKVLLKSNQYFKNKYMCLKLNKIHKDYVLAKLSSFPKILL